MAERVNIGSRLRVPFREKSALATVLAVLDQSDAEGIRPIEAIVGEAPILTEPLLELAKWMAAYYCCPIETVIRSLLPQVVRKAEVGWKKQLFVQPAGEIASEEIEKLRRRAPRQAELLEAIKRLEQPVRAAELLRQTALDNQTLRALVKRGLAELREEAVPRDPHGDEQFVATTSLGLNREQEAALREITNATMNGIKFIAVARALLSARAARFLPPSETSDLSWSMKNTKARTNRKKLPAITRATSQSCARKWKSASSCSAAPRPRLRAITTRPGANTDC